MRMKIDSEIDESTEEAILYYESLTHRKLNLTHVSFRRQQNALFKIITVPPRELILLFRKKWVPDTKMSCVTM